MDEKRTRDWLETVVADDCGLLVPDDTMDSLVEIIDEKLLKAHAQGRAEGIREAAKIADRYEDQINGTQDFRNGWRESAEAIESAILTLLPPEKKGE